MERTMGMRPPPRLIARTSPFHGKNGRIRERADEAPQDEQPKGAPAKADAGGERFAFPREPVEEEPEDRRDQEEPHGLDDIADELAGVHHRLRAHRPPSWVSF